MEPSLHLASKWAQSMQNQLLTFTCERVCRENSRMSDKGKIPLLTDMIGYPFQTVLAETCLFPGNLCCPLFTFAFPQAFSGWGARGHLLLTPSLYGESFIHLPAVKKKKIPTKLPQFRKGSKGEFFHGRVLDAEAKIFSANESLWVQS